MYKDAQKIMQELMMNEQPVRDKLEELLEQCTEHELEMWDRMYPGKTAQTVEFAKVERCLQQVINTLKVKNVVRCRFKDGLWIKE